MSRRALAPVVATVVLIAVTVVLVATVGAVVVRTPSSHASSVAMSVTADPVTDRITLVHRGGGTLDVRELTVLIRLNGTKLTHQPPVPFFAARGFRAGPTGPFNSAADPSWSAGEAASVRLASTNRPDLDRETRVSVRVFSDGTLVAAVETTAA